MSIKRKTILIFMVLFLSACNSSGSSQAELVEEDTVIESYTIEETPAHAKLDQADSAMKTYSTNIHDYFPFDRDIVKYYKSDDGEEFSSFVQYGDETRIQFATRRRDTDNIHVYEKDENEIRVVFRKEGITYRENYLNQTGFVGVHLRGPVEIGTSWVNSDNQEAVITGVDLEIDGVSSIEVTTDTSVQYYGYQRGLIKQIKNINSNSITDTLERLRINQTTNFNIMIYLFDDGKWSQELISNDISMNSDAKDFLQLELVRARIISESVQINSMTRKLSDDRVYVDFNNEIYNGIESLQQERIMLQSIVRSVGYLYGVNEIYLWVEGEAYQGPFIEMAKNELLQITQ